MTWFENPNKRKSLDNHWIIKAFRVSGWKDSNLRPHAPQTCTLTGLSYTPSDLSGTKLHVYFKITKFSTCFLFLFLGKLFRYKPRPHKTANITYIHLYHIVITPSANRPSKSTRGPQPNKRALYVNRPTSSDRHFRPRDTICPQKRRYPQSKTNKRTFPYPSLA